MASTPKKSRTGKEPARPQPELYTTRIIKAGALLNDTKTLLSHWDSSHSVKDNLRRFQEENLFGKASRSRVEDVLRIFRQRYLKEEEVTRALVVLVQKRFPTAGLDRILYYHAAKADRLLHDVVTEILPTRTAQGISDIDVIDLQHDLAKWVTEGRTTTEWSEPTIRRVAQGLLSTLRDFGVLQGAVNKQIAPAYPNKISLVFEVSRMTDPTLRLSCVKALKDRGYKPTKKAFDTEATFSRFYRSSRSLRDSGNEEDMRDALQRLIGKAREEFPDVESVLKNVFATQE